MANSPKNTNRLYDGAYNFVDGVNSSLHPTLIREGANAWGVNISDIGGVLTTRPGYNEIIRLPDGRAQGCILFTPTGSATNLVAAVNGTIYVSPYPFTTFTKLANVQFSNFVDHIVFKICLQTLDNGNIVSPRSVLLMQDGPSRAAFWDGSNSRHLDPGASETPQGLWMEWVGNRLWVSRGNQVFAGDIGDPIHFIENTYLSSGGSFQPIDGLDVTALAKTADNKALIVFTAENTTIVRAGITDRTQWKTTIDFIGLLFIGVGCVAGKSITYLNGELFWFSKEGARRFSQVASQLQVATNSVGSVEMERSFENISPIASRTCAFSFDTSVGFSVPSGDVHNRHTWVLDVSIENTLGNNLPPAWQGIWMGTRPVEWTSAKVNGVARCFYISQDRDGGVRIWEAFIPNQMDNGNKIFSSIEGRGLMFKELLSFKKMKFTELHLTQVMGEVDNLTVEYKGDYGCWKQIMDINICVQICNQLSCSNMNTALSPQNRYYKTQEALHECLTQEGPYSEDIGTYFQNRIRWNGVCGVFKYRTHAIQFEESSNGACAVGDEDSNGKLVCKPLLCCDQEVDYISPPNDHNYGYGSSNSISTSF